MARFLLSKKDISNAAPKAREYLLSDGDGLFLRVRTTGHRSWIFVYSLPAQRKYGLGSYPAITLARARELAEAARQLVAAGIHPADDDIHRETKPSAAAAEAAAIDAPKTVADLFARWDKNYLSRQHKDGGLHVRGMFNHHTAPVIGDTLLTQLRPRDIAAVLDKAHAAGLRRTCGMLLGHLSQMCNYALPREWLPKNPTAGLAAAHWGGASVERERNLSEAEIVELAAALQRSNFAERWQVAVWLILATGTRVGETLQARPEHIFIDQARWLIPVASQKKTNSRATPRNHWIDLSPYALRQATRLIELAGEGATWLFPSRGGLAAVDEKTLTKAIKNRQRDAPLKGRTQAVSDLQLSGGPWTPHDLRRTSSTLMGELGVRPDVIDKCQNHSIRNKITRTYQRQKMAPQMKEAWLILGERLDQLTGGLPHEQADKGRENDDKIHEE